jgi:hypothetical protein
MTNVLQWRKTTWVLLLWGGYVPAWAVITGSGPAIVAVWWLAGAIVFVVLWLGTQPLLRQGRGLSGSFPGPAERAGASSISAELATPRSAGAMRVECRSAQELDAQPADRLARTLSRSTAAS